MKRMFLVMAIAFVTILQVSAQDNNRQMTAQQRTEHLYQGQRQWTGI